MYDTHSSPPPPAAFTPASTSALGFAPRTDGFDALIGKSSALEYVRHLTRTVAATDSTVLIRGETGTGKELIARALHLSSPRRNGPFVRVNCAAIPAGLLDSELMGHEKGAFTGAIARRIGRFELAHGGTIFLDEIGELPIELQPKLLRLLQEREFERVGGMQTVRSNARVVAATNRDLAAMIDERSFREDLFYRLSVFPIGVPALRERREDIPLLVEHFVGYFAARMGRRAPGVPLAVLDRLVQHDWPGNIRELQNVIERAVILAADSIHDMPLEPLRGEVTAALPAGLAAVNRAHILKVLEATHWVIAGPNGAAARLGLPRSTLTFRMKKLGIRRPAPSFSRFSASSLSAHADGNT
jgi:transcriptional regulator with GAF, ATPase, and Fis domain